MPAITDRAQEARRTGKQYVDHYGEGCPAKHLYQMASKGEGEEAPVNPSGQLGSSEYAQERT